MSRGERTLHQSWPAGTRRSAACADASRRPRRRGRQLDRRHVDDVSRSAEGRSPSYERTIVDDAASVDETIRYRLVIPWFGWLFALPVRNTLRHRPADDRVPWWSPPDRLRAHTSGDPRACWPRHRCRLRSPTHCSRRLPASPLTVSAIDERAQGVGGVIVRLGVVIAIPFAMLADRRGRRQIIIITAWLAPMWCALGAIAPNFWMLVGTQTVARPIGLALALLIGVVAAEEMPRSSRAYALSVLALAGGLGAGVAVVALRLADLGTDGWRLIYLLSLIWLLPAYQPDPPAAGDASFPAAPHDRPAPRSPSVRRSSRSSRSPRTCSSPPRRSSRIDTSTTCAATPAAASPCSPCAPRRRHRSA